MKKKTRIAIFALGALPVMTWILWRNDVRLQPVPHGDPTEAGVELRPTGNSPKPPVSPVAPMNSEERSPEDELAEIARVQGLAAALEKAKSGSERERKVKFVLFLASSTDPEFTAREIVQSGLSATGKDQVVHSLMSDWPDASRALEWADKNLSGSLKASAVSVALARIARSDPGSTLVYLDGMPPGEERNQMLSAVLSSWASVDVVAALAYAKESLSPEDYSSTMIDVAPSWVEKDLAGAKNHLSQTSGNPESKYLGHLIGARMAAADPAGTLAWLSPQIGVAADRARRSAVITWVDRDPAAASAYIDSLPLEEKAKYAPALAGSWAENNPEDAARWVATLTDEGLQTQAILELLHRWQPTDAQAAAEWLDRLRDGHAKEDGFKFLNARDSVPLDKRFGIHPKLYIQAAEDSGLFASKHMCSSCGVVHPTTKKH